MPCLFQQFLTFKEKLVFKTWPHQSKSDKTTAKKIFQDERTQCYHHCGCCHHVCFCPCSGNPYCTDSSRVSDDRAEGFNMSGWNRDEVLAAANETAKGQRKGRRLFSPPSVDLTGN